MRRTPPSRETRTTDPGTPLWALPASERAIRVPSGEKRGLDTMVVKRASSRSFPPARGATRRADDRSSARRRRRNPTSVPSGDTSPASALLKRRRSSPPTTGTLQIEGPSFSSVRVKRIDWPSGKNLGSVSAGPFVRTVSPSPRICFSQMRGRPPRRDEKATSWPSGEAAGEESAPEWVSARRTAGTCAGRSPSLAIRSAPRRAPATSVAIGTIARWRLAAMRQGKSPASSPGPAAREMPESDSSANARSRADWNRAAFCFSRHRRTIRSSCGTTPRRIDERSGGSSRTIAAIVSAAEPARKARWPASIS